MRLIQLETQSANGRGASRRGGAATKIELEAGRKAAFSLPLVSSPSTKPRTVYTVYPLTGVPLSGEKRMAGFSKIPKANALRHLSTPSFFPSD